MTDRDSNPNLSSLRSTLETLSIQELRTRASKQFGLKLPREANKESIIDLIVGVAQKKNFAQLGSGDLQPGFARIRVHATNGKTPFPFYTNTNGYEAFIPFNVDVDVPIKVLDTLRNAEEMILKSDENEEIREFSLSYPFTLIDQVPGPDPRPGLEAQREVRLRPKRAFLKKFGYWPSDRALLEYRNGNLVPQLDDGDN